MTSDFHGYSNVAERLLAGRAVDRILEIARRHRASLNLTIARREFDDATRQGDISAFVADVRLDEIVAQLTESTEGGQAGNHRPSLLETIPPHTRVRGTIQFHEVHCAFETEVLECAESELGSTLRLAKPYTLERCERRRSTRHASCQSTEMLLTAAVNAQGWSARATMRGIGAEGISCTVDTHDVAPIFVGDRLVARIRPENWSRTLNVEAAVIHQTRLQQARQVTLGLRICNNHEAARLYRRLRDSAIPETRYGL